MQKTIDFSIHICYIGDTHLDWSKNLEAVKPRGFLLSTSLNNNISEVKMFIVDSKRINTMKLRLGKASELVDDDNYLPMFRSRQKQYPEEFREAVKIAKTKKSPSCYFATIWSSKNLKKSLEWLRQRINRLKIELADRRHQREMMAREKHFEKEFNPAGRDKLEKMISANLFNLRT